VPDWRTAAGSYLNFGQTSTDFQAVLAELHPKSYFGLTLGCRDLTIGTNPHQPKSFSLKTYIEQIKQRADSAYILSNE
jgi:hypothetical protein